MLLFIGSFQLNAQSRDWGVGVRFGSPTALSIKHYTGNNAIEGNIGSNISDRFIFQLHYLINNDISLTPNWKWYYGFGGQVQIGDYHDHDDDYHNHHGHSHDNFDIGADGVFGTEYRFSDAPFSVFLDLNVFVEIVDDPLDIDLQGGIGVRYDF